MCGAFVAHVRSPVDVWSPGTADAASASCTAGRTCSADRSPAAAASASAGSSVSLSSHLDLVARRLPRHPQSPRGPIGRVTRPLRRERPAFVDQAQHLPLVVLQCSDHPLQLLRRTPQPLPVQAAPLQRRQPTPNRDAHTPTTRSTSPIDPSPPAQLSLTSPTIADSRDTEPTGGHPPAHRRHRHRRGRTPVCPTRTDARNRDREESDRYLPAWAAAARPQTAWEAVIS